jgi:hypothetical protein
MKINAFNPNTGQKIADNIKGINFGNVRKGKHSSIPILIRPEITEEDVIGLELYLQNNGGFNKTHFGYFTFSDFVPVKSYEPPLISGYFYISDHFITTPDPPAITGGVHININDNYGDYIWLDVQPDIDESGGSSTINYRFIFEYF